jgi:hypothetical protein
MSSIRLLSLGFLQGHRPEEPDWRDVAGEALKVSQSALVDRLMEKNVGMGRTN